MKVISKFQAGDKFTNKEVKKWGNDWRWRLTPESRSKVLTEWRQTGVKPKAETSEEYTKRRVKETSDKSAKETKWMRKTADALHTVGTVASGVGLAGSMILNPVATTGAIIGGTVGDKAIDKAVQEYTRDDQTTWAKEVNNKLGLRDDSMIGHLSNPGAWIGGGLGVKGTSLGKQGINTLIQMDMPRFGYTPTTKLHFDPNATGMNGIPTVQADDVLEIPITRIFRGIRNTGASATPQQIINRLNTVTMRNPDFQIGINNNIPTLRGTRSNLIDLQNDINRELSKTGNRISIVSEPTQSSHNSVIGIGNPVINEKTINARAPMNRTRTAEEVKQFGRYKPEDFFDSDGNLINPHSLGLFDQVNTGAHGSFINPNSSPEQVFTKLMNLYNSSDGMAELRAIQKANPRGRSGILVHTHNGDLSVDSHELALAMERSLGEQFIPIKDGSSEFVQANPFGYKNLFADKKLWQMDDSLIRDINLGKSPSGSWSSRYLNNYLVDREPGTGSLIVRDVSGRLKGYIPALSGEEVLEKGFNAPIRKLNKKFGTNFSPARIVDSFQDPQWTFRKGILYPNQLGFILKKGGKFNDKH